MSGWPAEIYTDLHSNTAWQQERRHGQLIVADQKQQQQLVTVGFFNPSIDFLPLILFQHFREDTFQVYPGWNIPKTPQLRGNPVSTRT